VVTALICAQVIVRYALGGSLVWSEELTRCCSCGWCWLPPPAHRRCVSTCFVDMLPPRLRALLRLLSETIVLALVVLLLYGAWGMIELTEFDTYTALGISLRWLYLALLVGGAMWVLRSLAILGRCCRELFA
jgi:TRAP-type C4-dicarboxylate transport system permease small subunit